MLSLILGIIGLHFQLKAVSIAAIVLGLITLAITTVLREGETLKLEFRIRELFSIDYHTTAGSTLTTLIKFAFELGGLALGIIGVL